MRAERCAAGCLAVVALAGLAGCGRPVTGQRSSGPPVTALPTAVLSARTPSAIPSRVRAAHPALLPPLPNGPTGPAHAPSAPSTRTPAPVRVRIPSIGVDSRLQALGLDRNGVLQTPSRYPVAGWYAGGVRPGDVGPAVIAGHVDSVSGPAVFFRLRDLRLGALVLVTRSDGSTVRFRVARTARYPKDRFPTEAVYGPSPVPTLRLVTCVGDFDVATRSYVDNLVVTAYSG